MDDLISRQAAIDAVCKYNFDYPQYMERFVTELMDAMKADLKHDIEALPSAEPETAKRIVGKSRDGMTLWYQCDMCNEPVDAQDNFCRGCGRRLIDE